MATLSQAKTYGGIGAILTLLMPVPTVGWLLSIAGFVLTLYAVKYISEIVKDQSIWNDMLISIIVAIVGVFVAFFVLVTSLLRFMGLNGMNFADMGSSFNPSSIPSGDVVGLVMWALAGIAVLWIVLTVSGVFFHRGYGKIGAALNIGMFNTAGLLFLVGAATTILIVGFLLIPISLILLAVAFFSINENAPPSLSPGPVPT